MLIARSLSSLRFMLHCMSLLLAQSGHPNTLNQCPLLGVKRTSRKALRMSAFDPSGHLVGARYDRLQRCQTIGQRSWPRLQNQRRFDLVQRARFHRWDAIEAWPHREFFWTKFFAAP